MAGNQVYDRLEQTLALLQDQGNLRSLPAEDNTLIDFTSNDYLGIAENCVLRQEFFNVTPTDRLLLTSSASRLLALKSSPYARLEAALAEAYGRPALLFNSGYHANVGIIQALADKSTLIIADRLVHASIIDGIRLSGAPFERFRHNDYEHLNRLLRKYAASYATILVIVESVYSMDGDCADIDLLLEAKSQYDNVLLYVDEAHAFGCEGPAGLGLVAASKDPFAVDVVMATLGKAAASQGAFAICSETMRNYLINKTRSLIFSTAIPPIAAEWTLFLLPQIMQMDYLRRDLHQMANRVSEALTALGSTQPSHTAIQPLIIGDPHKTILLSRALERDGVKVMPIRTPTVPPGTERLRISLSAACSQGDIDHLINSLHSNYEALLHR